MQHPSKIFNDESRKRINGAITAAESKTSAEIVPVVAASSGRYDRAEDMAGLLLTAAALVAAWHLFRIEDSDPGGWTAAHFGLNLWEILAIVVIAFTLGAFITSHVGWLRRLFALRSHMRAEVHMRAHQMFFDQRIHHTKSRGGVLLYVSLFERMAVVIADDAVTEKLGKQTIEQLCDQFTSLLRQRHIVEAMGEIIKVTGDKLGAVLPRQDGDVNELPDALVVD